MEPVILQDIGTEDAVRKAVANSAAAKSTFPKLSRPPHLQGEALSAWKRYIEPLNLDASREPCALVFVELWSQFRADPKSFRSSSIPIPDARLLQRSDGQSCGERSKAR